MPGQLKTYRKKRDFKKTPGTEGREEKKEKPSAGTGSSAENDELFLKAQKKLKKAPQPGSVKPMLATLAGKKPFPKEGWIYESKLDGQRCIALRSGQDLRLISRNQILVNGNYPELVQAMLAQPSRDFIADGEIVAFRKGLPSFEELQPRMQIRDPVEAMRTGIKVFYYLFDLIYLEGYELANLELRLRKDILRQTFTFRDPVRFAEHKESAGVDFFEESCKKGFEGVIAKKADSLYRPGRSMEWQKFKCGHGQEFVIGGYTDPGGARTGFGALLLGYYEKGKLVYAGKVGTGFDQFMLDTLAEKLGKLEQKERPFAPHPELSEKGEKVKRGKKNIHWVKPELTGEVEFSEWTSGGLLRQPRFKGLRPDKPAREVVREEA
ncbi:MAG: non-homologous end-joining DNA ligase [Nitrospiraceae bacterium]|nr:non-homologous end-joining DNA ligase [Nitrospiraceae bacterium]